MENNQKEIRGALVSTLQEVLSRKKHHHEEWACIDTLGKIQRRENKKTAINNSLMRTEKDKS